MLFPPCQPFRRINFWRTGGCNVLHGSIERRNTEERSTSCIVIRATGETDGAGERKSLPLNGCAGECTPCRFVNKPSSRIGLLKKRRWRFDRRVRRICRCSLYNMTWNPRSLTRRSSKSETAANGSIVHTTSSRRRQHASETTKIVAAAAFAM